MADLRVQNLGSSLKILFVDNTELIRDKRHTYTSQDVVATATTIRVQSIAGFEQLSTSSGQVVLLGNIGEERSEILTTSTTSGQSPSAFYKEITFSGAMQFDHPQDTKVHILDWNRVEFQYAATAGGTKTTIIAYPVNIRPDDKETSLRDITDPAARLASFSTAAYYFARFNATIENRNSDWSDAVYGTGYDDNSVFAVKQRAVDELSEHIDDKVITHDFLNKALWQARREYHQALGKRPFRRKYNVDIGNALTGSFRIELPSDVERPYSAENVYGVRIGSNANMEHYDKKEWDDDYRNIAHSTLTHAYTANTSTSLWLANGRDFGASAVINVEGELISVTRIEGLTGESYYNSLRIYAHPSNAYSASVGSDAWENASFGLPSKFAVWADVGGSAYIYFNRPIDTAYVGQNIYLDYYRTLVGMNSNGDILDEPDYDMYVDYLKAKIKARKDRGMDISNDSDYRMWLTKKQNALDKEFLGVDISFQPDISHLSIPN